MKEITVGKRKIGVGHPVFIIAEMSANHMQNYDRAVQLIKAAKRSGADAIKLQTYTADTMTIASDVSDFKIKGGLWDGETLYDLYARATTPWEWYGSLKKVAEQENIILFSTPFDKTATDFLEKHDVPAYKIASFEAVDIPLIEYIASKGKPVFISTGICNEEEIDDAVAACRRGGNEQIILLKCTSAYPAPIDAMVLRMIPEMQNRFGTLVGLSDHTMSSTGAIVSVALGACIVEKHMTLKRSDGGADSGFSLEAEEFQNMVTAIREAEAALGTVSYNLSNKNTEGRIFCRSLYVISDVKSGDIITELNVRSIRPGYGMAPKHFSSIIGKRFTIDVKRGTPLSFEMLEE